MKLYYLAAMLLVISGTAFRTNAETQVCSRSDAIKAEQEASSIKDWDGLYKSFVRYSYCDDGAISEGYSDTVARLLSKDWDSLDKLAAFTKNNQKFENFVIRHIDATVPADEIYAIKNNASSKCIKSDKCLCKKILDRIDALIKEQKESG